MTESQSTPKSFWWYDYNYRVYKDDAGNHTSAPNKRLHWRELAVVGETSRSWVLANDVKIPKNKPLPHGYKASYDDVLDWMWRNDHSYKISEAVRKVDVKTLRKIAELIGYEAA